MRNGHNIMQLTQISKTEIKSAIGTKIHHRWNDLHQWSYGILIGETENGFEVYSFCIEREEYIEYVGQISLKDPHSIGHEILYSDKFTERNLNNYNFKKLNNEHLQN
jgi:hypothetical protein